MNDNSLKTKNKLSIERGGYSALSAVRHFGVSDPSQQNQTANADETVAGNVTFTAKAAWTATAAETTVTRASSSGVEWVRFLVNGKETYLGAAGTVAATERN